MTDYGKADRQRFLRQVRLLAWLRRFYVALGGLSIGAALVAIFNTIPKGH